MSSKYGGIIVSSIRKLLNRKLSADETIRCEELAINIYIKAVVGYIDRLSPEDVKFKFNNLYGKLINGYLRGAMRRPIKEVFKFSNQSDEQIYKHIHYYLGDGFSQQDLDSIVWLTKHASVDEVVDAVDAARRVPVFSARYVCAIIEGNRKKAALSLKQHRSNYKKISDADTGVRTGVPDVKEIQKRWTRKLKSADESSSEDSITEQIKRKKKF